MKNLCLLIATIPLLGFNIKTFVYKWDMAILDSISKQKSSIYTPRPKRDELDEALPFFLDKKGSNSSNDVIRSKFISFCIQNSLLPLKSGGIIIENPSSGEQFILTYFLLIKNRDKYVARIFNYSSDWKYGKSIILPSSYVKNLLSDKYCYYQGNNASPVIITKFTPNGDLITSQYFVRASLCASLNRLNNL